MAVIAHWIAAAAVALGCSRVEEPTGATRAPVAAPSGADASAPRPAPAAPLLTPTQLLTLSSSAYQAAIFADDDGIELLTSGAAYHLAPGREPQRRALDLGFAATVTRRSYVYWSKGALRRAPRRAHGALVVELVVLPDRPQRIVADISRDELAWLRHSADGRDAIETLAGGRVKELYASAGSIDALTMLGGAVYFVERPGAEGFRIGRLPLAEGGASFTQVKSGRFPAMLGGGPELVYYDGSRRRLQALSLDLKGERTLADDFICSPLTAARHVYCAGVEGVFEVPDHGAPRPLIAASTRVVTGMASSSERLAFVTDVGEQGEDRLAVSYVQLPR